MEDCALLEIAFSMLEKIMPSFQKDPLASPSGNLKSLVNSLSTHFDSLEKLAEEKVWKEFLGKSFTEAQGIITNDRSTLDIGIKSLENALKDGGNMYKFFLSWPKVIEDIEKKVKEQEGKLSSLSQNFDPLTTSLINQEC